MEAAEHPRVLIIDDDPVIRSLLCLHLSKNGYELLEARDGREGVALFFQENPNVILCDMRMPHLDGIGVLKVVRKEAPQTPIVMISGGGLLIEERTAMPDMLSV